MVAETKRLLAVTTEVGGGRVGKRLGRRRASSIIATGGEMACLRSASGHGDMPRPKSTERSTKKVGLFLL